MAFNPEDNADFEYQLKQMYELEKNAASNEDSTKAGPKEKKRRTEEDGTVMEYDEKRGGWFPVLDEDFLAQYQMNYGCPSAAAEPSSNSDVETFKQFLPQEPDNVYYKTFCDWYYGSKNGAPTEEEPVNGSEKATGDCAESTAKTTSTHDDAFWVQYYTWYYENVLSIQSATNTSAEQNVEEASSAASEAQEESTSKQAASSSSVPSSSLMKNKKRKADWFEMDPEQDTHVYVSGLPLDITEKELEELVQKAGMVKKDPITNKLKVKLYRDQDGNVKGDGTCCYMKKESIDLAKMIIDGIVIRGHKVSLEKAKFTLKGNFDPKKRKRALTNKEKRRQKQTENKLLSWTLEKPQGLRVRSDRTVIIKGMFKPAEFDADPLSICSLKEKLKQQLSRFGEVRKVQIYDRNPEGVVAVTFTEPEQTDLCIDQVNGRILLNKVVTAATWDGRTKYTVVETDEQRRRREALWNQHLGGDSSEDDESDDDGGGDGGISEKVGSSTTS